MSQHVFIERLHLVKGGQKALPAEFWKVNNDDLDRVNATLTYLLHGQGDSIQRFHDVLYDQSRKLKRIDYFCALELYGTMKPDK